MCLGELRRVHQLPCALPGWFVQMDDKTPEGCTGALRSQRARPTTFAGPNIGIGAVAMTSAAVVEGLTCGTDIAIAFGLISKPLGTVERAESNRYICPAGQPL